MLARTRNELEWTIFVPRKREIFQRKRVFCLAFQRNRELSLLSLNCPEKATSHRRSTVIALFLRSYNGYFVLALKGFYRHDVFISRLH